LEFHQISPFVKKESRTITAGKEFRPAPKKTVQKYTLLDYPDHSNPAFLSGKYKEELLVQKNTAYGV
jgi:hypothetical protein